jgi:hypothetical protein
LALLFLTVPPFFAELLFLAMLLFFAPPRLMAGRFARLAAPFFAPFVAPFFAPPRAFDPLRALAVLLPDFARDFFLAPALRLLDAIGLLLGVGVKLRLDDSKNWTRG